MAGVMVKSVYDSRVNKQSSKAELNSPASSLQSIPNRKQRSQISPPLTPNMNKGRNKARLGENVCVEMLLMLILDKKQALFRTFFAVKTHILVKVILNQVQDDALPVSALTYASSSIPSTLRSFR